MIANVMIRGAGATASKYRHNRKTEFEEQYHCQLHEMTDISNTLCVALCISIMPIFGAVQMLAAICHWRCIVRCTMPYSREMLEKHQIGSMITLIAEPLKFRYFRMQRTQIPAYFRASNAVAAVNTDADVIAI